MDGLPTEDEAFDVAERAVASLVDRWRHTQAVAARAKGLCPAVGESDRQLLVVAAWLHDVGYGPAIASTGFHPLDGAWHLLRLGYPRRLCALVAHHSAAMIEAEERGMAAELAEWEREEGPVADALWAADMTTGPQGQRFTYPERLAEILDRYEPGSVVHRAMTRAQPLIEGAIERTERRLAAAAG